MALDDKLVEKLEGLARRQAELERQMADPEVLGDTERYQQVAKEHADLSEVVTTFTSWREMRDQMAENRDLMDDDDAELAELAAEEVAAAKEEMPRLEDRLKILLLPKDPNDEKNVILEVRAGTGGEEAALFAADLFRMYLRFAERAGWSTEILSSHETPGGGYKEVIALINGRGAYSQLKYESGVHRVQRVPETETQGRIHTSAVTVAVLPEAEDVEVDINPEDLRIDVFRASGPGGQHVNKTESAVRITHLPTGLVVSCQDEKSQHKNKAKAMKVLQARLLDKFQQEQHDQEAEARRSQVGSGDRSERIRTYNFPQGRVSDHRIGLTVYKLAGIMDGDLSELIPPIITHFQTEAMQAAGGH